MNPFVRSPSQQVLDQASQAFKARQPQSLAAADQAAEKHVDSFVRGGEPLERGRRLFAKVLTNHKLPPDQAGGVWYATVRCLDRAVPNFETARDLCQELIDRQPQSDTSTAVQDYLQQVWAALPPQDRLRLSAEDRATVLRAGAQAFRTLRARIDLSVMNATTWVPHVSAEEIAGARRLHQDPGFDALLKAIEVHYPTVMADPPEPRAVAQAWKRVQPFWQGGLAEAVRCTLAPELPEDVQDMVLEEVGVTLAPSLLPTLDSIDGPTTLAMLDSPECRAYLQRAAEIDHECARLQRNVWSPVMYEALDVRMKDLLQATMPRDCRRA